MIKKAIFYDRDGIITKLVKNEAPQKVTGLQIIPEIIPVIRQAKKCGYLNIVVSNQPDFALGKITQDTQLKLEERFEKLIKEQSLPIDAVYYCHHSNNQNCSCKKPKPGLLLKAAKKLNVDLPSSFTLGDRASDIKASRVAGTKTILYDPQNTQLSYLIDLKVIPDYTVKNLSQVIPIICKQ